MSLDPLDIRYFKMAVSTIKSESENDIAAKCPICGDSKHSNKARLHLYQKNNLTFVNCFNGGCPCVNKTMVSFLKEFYPNLLLNYKKEKLSRAIQSNSFLEKPVDWMTEALSNQAKQPTEEQPKTPTVSLKQFFKPLSQAGLLYLKSRGLADVKGVYTAASNAFLDKKRYRIKDFIIIPLIKDKEIYGFYTRSTETKEFMTYIKPNYIGFKAWNLFQVNLDEPVYVFEGIFDAMSAIKSGLKNSIALMGSTMSEEIKGLVKYPIFCLDNDYTGISKSLQYCNEYPVVIWPFDSPKDANEMLLQNIDIYNTIMSNTRKGIRAVVGLKAKL